MSPPSSKEWETTASPTTISSTTTLTGWQHHFSTELPPLEGSSGTIRQIFQLDSSKCIVKFPVDKTDRLWLYIHRRYITGCIPCRPYPFPSTLLLNVLEQIAAFLGYNKKTILHMYSDITSCLHPASCTMDTGSFPGVKRLGHGADHPPPSSIMVTNE
jgi:hypothetical protein